MPSETPVYHLPYPIGSDPVADGDNAMRALAEALENALITVSSSSTVFGFPAGVTNQEEGCIAWRQGNIIVARIAVALSATIASGQEVCRLPAGFYPAAGNVGRFVLGGSASATGATVAADGVVRAYYTLSTGGWAGTVVFVNP